MSLGKAVLNIRRQRNMTQRDVSDRAGLATSYLSRIENGHIQPTMGTLSRVAEALGVPMASLFRIGAEGSLAKAHKCPVSSSGDCIGELLRSTHGKKPKPSKRGSVHYGKQELHLLRMTEYLALHGTQEIRRALAVVLESMIERTDKPVAP